MGLDLSIFVEYGPSILQGFQLTIFIVICAIFLGLPMGVLLAVGRMSSKLYFRAPAGAGRLVEETLVDRDRLLDQGRLGVGLPSGIAAGHLDRAALRSLVFADPAERQALEAILHPRIRAESLRRIANLDAGIAESVRILYGGSMNPGNAADLIAQADIDGGLIGGASLKADDFLAIVNAAG